jgi:hypothetical protein
MSRAAKEQQEPRRRFCSSSEETITNPCEAALQSASVDAVPMRRAAWPHDLERSEHADRGEMKKEPRRRKADPRVDA